MSGATDRSALSSWGLVLGVLVAAVATFFALFERVEEETTAPMSSLARANPQLAFARSLTALGLPATARYGLGTLPPPSTTIVVFEQRARARAPMVERLADWVETGGHLVVVAAAPDEPLALAALEALVPADPEPVPEAPDPAPDCGAGLPADDCSVPSASPAPAPPLEAPAADTGAPRPETGGWAPDPAPPVPLDDPLLLAFGWQAWSAGGPGPRLRHRFPPDQLAPLSGQDALVARLPLGISLSGAPSAERSAVPLPPDGTRPPLPAATVPVLHTAWGAGQVTAITALDFLENTQLDDQGMAAGWRLLHPPGRAPSAALLVLRGESPSLATLLWTHAWTAVISAAVLIIALLWMGAGAFGPPLRSPPPVRRSLREHIEAVGVWHWRHGHHDLLLAELRRSARARLAARSTALASARADDHARLAAALTGLPAADIEEALAEGQRVATRRDLIRIVSTLRALALGPAAAPRSAP